MTPDTPSDQDLWHQLREQLAPGEPRLRPAGPVGGNESPGLSGIVLHYQPIWNVQQKAIGIHFGEPLAAAAEAGLSPGELDGRLLRRVLVDIAAAARQHAVGSVCLPVHFASLATAGPRRDLLAVCDAIPEELRSSLLWELIELPDAIVESTLFSVVSAISPYGRAIFMRRGLEQTDFDAPAAVGVHSIGTDLRQAAGSETQWVEQLERFAERAHAVGLRCHAHGLQTSSQSLTAIGAGFDYVAGPAISGTTDLPWGVLPYDAENLFRHRLAPRSAGGSR